jgi:hypothetical protein
MNSKSLFWLFALVVASGCNGAPKSSAELEKMAKSAVYAMAKNYKKEFKTTYNLLLRDEEVSVRRAAMRSAYLTKDKSFIETLNAYITSSNTDDSRLADEAIKQLQSN